MTLRTTRGFTLVEMLVTCTILVMIVSAGFTAFNGSMRSAAKTRRYGAMIQAGQLAIEQIATDIRRIVPHGDVKLTSLDVNLDGRDLDTIDFIIARPRRDRKRPDEGGRAEVGYYIDTNPDTEAEWLLRREDPTLDDDPLGAGTVSLAGPHVWQLNLEFFDGTEWQAGWDGNMELPKAVHVGLMVLDKDEHEKPLHFRTTVQIMAR